MNRYAMPPRLIARLAACSIALAITFASTLISTPAAANTAAVRGTLGAVGSDTMAGLMLRWGEALAQRYPDVTLQFQAGGSANAASALIAGTARLGPMSRPMTRTEKQRFARRYGYPPLELKVARDALVVVVHRHNPLRVLTRRQLDAIFSTTRECGAARPILRWQALDATRDWPFGRIALHGRNLASGTHALFQRRALCGGEFRRDISEHPGSAAVVAAVGESPGAMGYAGYHHLSAAVRGLSLYNVAGKAIAPSRAAIQRGDYPLSRSLYLYVNAPPEAALPPAEQALLALIFSPRGQQIARAAGFVALPEPQRKAQNRW